MHRFTLSLAAALTTALVALPVSVLADQGSFERDGVTIQYTDEGTGPAVVMLHAFSGSQVLWQEAGLAPLAGYRTITFDARGHGASDKPTDAGAYGLEMVEDVAALLEDRSIEAAHVVGYSMGAETALKFANLYPERVLSLTVAGSGWSGAEEAGTYGFISQALAGSESFGAFMAAMAPEAEEGWGPEEQAEMMQAMAGHGIDPAQPAQPLAGVAGGMPALLDLDADDLGAFDFPVLGLAGEADAERENVERLGGAVGDYRFVMIPGTDHLGAPLSPVFAEAVTDFLAE